MPLLFYLPGLSCFVLDSLIHLDQIVSSLLDFDKVFLSIGAPQSSLRHELASVWTEIAI